MSGYPCRRWLNCLHWLRRAIYVLNICIWYTIIWRQTWSKVSALDCAIPSECLQRSCVQPVTNGSFSCYGDPCSCSLSSDNQSGLWFARINCSGSNLTAVPRMVPFCDNTKTERWRFLFDILLDSNYLVSFDTDTWNISDDGGRIIDVFRRTYSLNLSHNSIKSLSFSQVNFDQLEFLYIDHNELWELSAIISLRAPGLMGLYAHANNIKYIPTALENITTNSPYIKALSLHGNRWSCNCRSRLSLTWLRNHSNIIVEVSSVVCASPYQLAGKALVSLRQEDFDVLDCDLPVARRGIPKYAVIIIVLVVVYLLGAAAFPLCLALRNRHRVTATDGEVQAR